MKIAMKIAATLGVSFLLLGCSNTTPLVEKTQSFDLNKQHIVKHYKDAYYYRPNHSWSYKLTANSANLNNVASGGHLSCKENDIWFISAEDRAEEEKIRYSYFITLAKSQLDDMKEDPEFIPRRDSQEYKDLIEIDTKMVQQGLIGCSGQIPNERIEKIIPMSDIVSIP